MRDWNLWNVKFSFAEIGFYPDAVAELKLREAETIAKHCAFNWLMYNNPELRLDEFGDFEFDIDWVGQNVVVKFEELV